MDLVTGAKRVIIAMQRTAKGKPKVLNKCTLTSARAVDLVVIEMAVIGFPGGRDNAPSETGAAVSVEQVVAATAGEAGAAREDSADAGSEAAA